MNAQQWCREIVKHPRWITVLTWIIDSVEENFAGDVVVACDRILDKAIAERQSLVDQGMIGTLIFVLEYMVNGADANQRLTFLKCVRDYDETIKRSSNEKIRPPEWLALAARFDAIDSVTTMVAAYRLNYMFLAARNAGESERVLFDLYKKARDAAVKLEQGEKNEFLGHLEYNMARFLLKIQKVDDALVHWKQSATARLKFHEYLSLTGAARERLQASAQQIWKLRGAKKDDRLGDFEYFFPGKPIDECSVPRNVFDDLVSEFGNEALCRNSAVPKK